jgi:hypothetical protein
MQSARVSRPLLPAAPDRPGRRTSDRRGLRRVAAALCLLLALYCLLAGAVSLAQTPAESDSRMGSVATRDRLPLLIPLIFLVFLVVTAAVIRRDRQPVPALPGRRPRVIRAR